MEATVEFQLIKEQVPHVAEKLKTFWGSEYFADYVNHIFLDTRDGARQGFPKDVAKALHVLNSIHEEQFPSKAKKSDVWEFAHKF